MTVRQGYKGNLFYSTVGLSTLKSRSPEHSYPYYKHANCFQQINSSMETGILAGEVVAIQ